MSQKKDVNKLTPKKTKRSVGQPTKYKPEHCKTLIDKMAEGFSYEAAAGFIGVSKQTVYDWEKRHPEWVEAKKEAFQKCQIFWEQVGLEGMFMGGKDNPFNSAVWIFNMKNRFNWTDRQKQEVQTTIKLEDMINDSFDGDEE